VAAESDRGRGAMALSGAQLAHWDAHGYVVARGLLDPATDLAPAVQDYESMVEALAGRLLAEGRISSTHRGEPFDTRYASICAEDTAHADSHLDDYLDIGRATARADTRGTFALMTNTKLLAPVEQLLGCSEIGWSPISHVRAKLPAAISPSSNVAAWHQDAIFCTDDADEVFLLTVWLPLTEATVEMGCLELMPGVHRNQTVYWSRSGGGVGETLPRDMPTVHEPLSPGDVRPTRDLCVLMCV
jgi:phytanoyl-CoA hydroxylase